MTTTQHSVQRASHNNKVTVCPRIGELPSLGITVPFRRVELHSFPIVCFSVILKHLQPILPIARIPKAIRNNTIRMLLSECLIPFQIRKSIVIKIAKILRIENCDVGVALLEYVLDIVLLGIPFEFLFWPNI